jgi:hypothetical protein
MGFDPGANFSGIKGNDGSGVREDHALGWGQIKMEWAPEPAITHTGSNEMNLAIAMFWPDKDFGFVMMTNVATKAADEAMQKLAAELYNRFSASIVGGN